MKTTIDLQTLLGFLSATGLPVFFKAVIGFVHPSLYTLTCGTGYVSGAANCYRDDQVEAILWLVLSLIAVAYGVYTLRRRLNLNPTPQAGTRAAVIPQGSVPVVTAAPGTGTQSVAVASPETVLQVTPATQAPPQQTPAKGS